MIRRGQLIVIEGLEGAGKSTGVQTVMTLLSEHGLPCIHTREPGGTEIGEVLRDIIKNPIYKDTLDDRSELLLLYAARLQLIEEVIKPALARGVWVVADRFELSSFAYQGGGRGLSQATIQSLSEFCLDGFKADLTLYLDLNPDIGMQRAQQRGAFDRIEQQKIDFFHKVHQAYLDYVHAHPEIIIVDASQDLATVQWHLQQAVTPFIMQQSQ